MREGPQRLAGGFRNAKHPLRARAADFRIVGAWFDHQHHVGAERLRLAFGEPRMLVDRRPDSVSRMMTIVEARVSDATVDEAMRGLGCHPRPELPDGKLERFMCGVEEPHLHLAR